MNIRFRNVRIVHVLYDTADNQLWSIYTCTCSCTECTGFCCTVQYSTVCILFIQYSYSHTHTRTQTHTATVLHVLDASSHSDTIYDYSLKLAVLNSINW